MCSSYAGCCRFQLMCYVGVQAPIIVRAKVVEAMGDARYTRSKGPTFGRMTFYNKHDIYFTEI